MFIEQELQTRREYIENAGKIEWEEVTWEDQDKIEEEIVNGWMNSPGHRQNILTSNFNQGGIGVVKINHFFIATQVFIEKVECGYETGACCEKAGYYPYCYVPLECVSGVCGEKD